MVRSIWLFFLAICLISCSNSLSSSNSTPPTASPGSLGTAIATERILTATPTVTPTPEAVLEAPATPQASLETDVNEILTKALSMMANVGTFHFVMDRDFFSEHEAEDLAMHIPVSGKFNAPDRVQGTIILSANEKSAILDFIIIGEELFLREKNSDTWQMIDWQSRAAQVVRENAYLPLEQFSPENFYEPVLVGEARLGGLPVYHIRSASGTLVEGQSQPDTNSIDLWIGKENHLIYRIISETGMGDPADLAINGRSRVQVDYASFGEPVLIVAPQVDTSGGFRPTGSYARANC